MITETPPSQKSLPRNIWAVTATSFLNDIASEMVLNLMPLFLANVLGARAATIGLIEGIAETTASLLKVYFGWISDKLGRRKQLAAAGYGLSALVRPLLVWAGSWTAVLGVRFADRVGKGIRTAPRDALIADSITPAQRGRAYGLHRAGDTAGAMLGILIALAVVWLVQSNGLALSRTAFQRVVLWSIVPGGLAVAALVIGVQETAVTRPRKRPRLSLKEFDSRFRRFLFIIILFTLGNSADAFLILRAQERGLSIVAILGMLAAFNLVYAALSGKMGSLSDRYGRRPIIIGGWLVYGALYLGFALARTAVHIWLLYALYGIYYAAFEGTAKAYVADLAPEAQRGTAFGVYNAAVGLAALPASLIAGILWQGVGSWPGFGPQAPFLFGAALAGTAVILFVGWAGGK